MFSRLSALAAASAVLAASAAAPSSRLFTPPGLYDTIRARANATLQQVPSPAQYPSNGVSGKYGWQTSSSSGWTSGFFPGLLWKLYEVSLRDGTSDGDWWMGNAFARTQGLVNEQYDTTTHDVGFIMVPSFGAQYRLTGNETAFEILRQTAYSLTTRFSPVVGCIQSWGQHPPPNHQFEVIIDNMMNLELLWTISNMTGNATMRGMADSHSQKMIADIYQPQPVGAVWHLVVYNDTDGTIISRSSTPQGLGTNTVWSRGQSWSINGFAIAYRFTQNPAYLAQAQLSADCFISLVSSCCINSQYKWAPLWVSCIGKSIAEKTRDASCWHPRLLVTSFLPPLFIAGLQRHRPQQ
jgi:hypothetical protein